MFICFVWSLYCIWYEVKSKMRSVAFSCLNIKDNRSLPSIKNTNKLNSRKKKKYQWIYFCFPFLKDRNIPRPIWNSLKLINNIIVKQQAWQLKPLIKDHMQWPIMSISQCTKMAGAPTIYSLSFFFFSFLFFFFFWAEWPTKYYKNQNCL